MLVNLHLSRARDVGHDESRDHCGGLSGSTPSFSFSTGAQAVTPNLIIKLQVLGFELSDCEWHVLWAERLVSQVERNASPTLCQR